MTYVCGIDPGLAAAGVAAIAHPSIADTPNLPRVRVVGETGHGTDTPAQTALRIRRQRHAVLRAMPPKVTLVVIEGLGHPNPKAPGMYRERAALVCGLEEYLAEHRIPFAEIPPAVLKLWATGDGHAEKPAVHDAMVAMWPAANLVGPRGHPNSNMSDALAAATVGAQRLGWYAAELPHHFSPKVQWPEGI